MKKILIPTDFSEQSIRAIQSAVSIAKDRSDIELILLHILDLPSQYSDMVQKGHDIPEIMFFKQMAENKIIELAKSPFLMGVKVSAFLQLGNTVDEVSKAALDHKVDLIVIGSHGTSRMKEYFVGSNTEKVVRTSKVPVMVIKGEDTQVSFEKVVFASDFLYENIESYKKILDFLSGIGVKPHFLMVNSPTNFKSTQKSEHFIKKFLNDLGVIEFEFSVYDDYTIEDGILNYSARENVDLIVMGSHGKKGLSKFLSGSVSEDLVNHSEVNLLTFKM